ncbi:MAG: ABC transporter ATP-binding protein [Lachnospiraceae bacterium]|nr:ABC transporter ATP-binding protein [Lachnospiraceae bacterium]
MLKIENLNVSYKKGSPILHNVSMHVDAGEIVGIIGMNGAGKSTLMRAISGVLPYQPGTIKIKNVDACKITMEQRQKISFLKAENNIYKELSVLENIKICQKLYKAKNATVKKAIELLRCEEILNKKVGELSSGMRQRVSIVTSTLSDYHLLLLDELTNAIDIETKKYIIEYVRSLSNEHNGILITSHNIKDIEELCDRIYILRKGEVVKETTVESILRESEEKNNTWFVSVPLGSDCDLALMSFKKNEYSVKECETCISIQVDEAKKQELLKQLILNEIKIISVSSMIDSLEDAVLEVMG